MAGTNKPLHILMDPALVEQVDEFRWRNRVESRKEAIEWLLRFALAQKPKVEK
jgi:metal-responsive CopG/Arc/MetJ family transcriptional regulator